MNNVVRLFYGSASIVEKPIFNFGNPSNDYGKGFYLTPDYDKAVLWASRHPRGGYVYTYDVDFTDLSVLRLASTSELDTLRWITLLVKHRFSYEQRFAYQNEINWLTRHFDVNLNNFDIVEGYRADDSYFVYSREFVAGNISINVLQKAMLTGKLGKQIVLISKKAFDHITTIDYKKVDPSQDYESFKAQADKEYHRLAKEQTIHERRLIDIMREYEDGHHE